MTWPQKILETQNKTDTSIMNDINFKKESFNFVFDEAVSSQKEVFILYGQKGAGKTYAALSFPGKIAAISFDMKTDIIKKNFYTDNTFIKIYDGVKYFEEDFDKATETAYKNYQYILLLLESIAKEKVDYVVIDCLDKLLKIAEFIMRYKYKLNPTQGIANFSIWKERRMIIKQIHQAALNASNKGVIYTTCVEKDEIVIDGNIVSKQDAPKSIDLITEEADVIANITSEYLKQNGKKFKMKIDSSKITRFKTGETLEITGVTDIDKLLKSIKKLDNY